jgi:hypothetical protein
VRCWRASDDSRPFFSSGTAYPLARRSLSTWAREAGVVHVRARDVDLAALQPGTEESKELLILGGLPDDFVICALDSSIVIPSSRNLPNIDAPGLVDREARMHRLLAAQHRARPRGCERLADPPIRRHAPGRGGEPGLVVEIGGDVDQRNGVLIADGTQCA